SLQSIAGIEALADGRVRILVSSTEIGQGTNTILAQIVAETLGIEYGQVEIAQPDTSLVPNSGPTVASRTCMVVGKLLESAAMGLKETLIKAGFLAENYRAQEFADACTRYVGEFGPLKSFSQY